MKWMRNWDAGTVMAVVMFALALIPFVGIVMLVP